MGNNMEWIIEIAQQAPALAVGLYMFHHCIQESHRAEKRLKALIEENANILKQTTETLKHNNQVLASIQILFLLVEQDLKDGASAKRRPPQAK